MTLEQRYIRAKRTLFDRAYNKLITGNISVGFIGKLCSDNKVCGIKLLALVYGSSH